MLGVSMLGVSMLGDSMLGDSMENRPRPGPSSDTPIEALRSPPNAHNRILTKEDSDEEWIEQQCHTPW